MIGKLKGIIDSHNMDHIIMDVSGVGYVVFCSSRVLQSLPSAGERAEIFTEMLVRENEIRLIGFASAAEQGYFRLLTQVQGVGPKMALSILGTLTLGELGSALATADKAMIARASGVGPKVAARIVTELKDRIPAFEGVDLSIPHASGNSAPLSAGATLDAVSALQNLGYGLTQAQSAVGKVVKELGEDASAQSLIRAALKELAQ